MRIRIEKILKATQEQLWELIVDPDNYRYWTAAFHEGSDFDGSWTKGSKIRFISADEDGGESGMLSEIAESSYLEFISIRHLGFLMNGVEDYDSPMAKAWAPAYENYRFIQKEDGSSIFELEQDVPEDQIEEFTGMWEEGFKLMEQLLESGTVGKVITLRAKSRLSSAEIWDRLVTPEKVMTWNFASEDWYCPQAKNDLKVGGEFHYEMAAKDGSMSFDFWGTYNEIKAARKLYFTLGDGRAVRINLHEKPYGCLIEERFEPEGENNLDLQRFGWQSILNRLAVV